MAATPCRIAFRPRSLDGDQSELRAPVAQLDAAHAGSDRACVLDHHVRVGGVDHDAVPVVREPAARAVDDHVVDDPAGIVEDQRVARRADRQPPDVQAGQPGDAGGGSGAGDVDLSHVADVEQAGRRAHRAVLGDDPGVLHGHAPAGERHHAGASRSWAACSGVRSSGACGSVSRVIGGTNVPV